MMIIIELKLLNKILKLIIYHNYLTTLHGKYFGKNQENLVNKINSINYDIIAIIGDIKNKHEDNIDAFLDMMNGINNKEKVFFVKIGRAHV